MQPAWLMTKMVHAKKVIQDAPSNKMPVRKCPMEEKTDKRNSQEIESTFASSTHA